MGYHCGEHVWPCAGCSSPGWGNPYLGLFAFTRSRSLKGAHMESSMDAWAALKADVAAGAVWTEFEPGDVIGYRASGEPILFAVGGAADNFDDWIPEETDSAVIQRVAQVSAVEAWGRHTPMSTATKKEPRSSGMEVKTLSKGNSYTSSNDENDDVLLTARKHTGLLTVAEEDLNDSSADIIATMERDWENSYAKYFDNATLATSSATTALIVSYTSLY